MKNKIIDKLNSTGCSCVAFDDNILLYESVGIGVKPIIAPMRGNISFFKEKLVGDKIVGKAAALLLALSGAKYVYGGIMSRSATAILEKYNIDYEYDKLVEYIENRTSTGMCPLEECVMSCDDKNECLQIIENRIKALMLEQNKDNH